MPGIIFCLFLLWSGPGFSSPAEEPEENNIPILDSTQEFFGGSLSRVANQIDLFFADQRADDELARSRIRIRRLYEVRERAGFYSDTQIRFNLRLPKLQERFKIEFNKKKKAEKKPDLKTEEASTSAPVNPNAVNTDWQFRADTGVNAKILPVVFGRARLRKNWETTNFIHRFVEELSWFSDRYWEEITRFDSDHSLGENLLFRIGHVADWRISKKTFSTSHGPALLHRISINDAFSYNANFSTSVVHQIWFLSNYRLSTTYRRNLYKQWLYMDLTSGLDFPKTWSFRRTPFIFMQIEALFGN